MSKNTQQPVVPTEDSAKIELNQQAIEFLMKEYDSLRELFTQADTSA